MTTKAFASSADLAEKQQTLEVLAEGVTTGVTGRLSSSRRVASGRE